MNKNIKILDCTLRDGGYHNNWNFSKELAKKMISSLQDCKVDFIEVGYRSLNGENFKKSEEKFLKNLKIIKKTNFACMIDVKEFISNNKLDKQILEQMFLPKQESVLDTCRVAVTYENLPFAIESAYFLKEKGYNVIMNIMGINLLKDVQIKEICKETSEVDINALYFADSFGSLFPEQVSRLTKMFVDHNKANVGFHAHDNQSLAFANTIQAIKNGATFIDSTILGMGRGAGNLRTEQILSYLENAGYDYSSFGLVSCLDDFEDLKAKHQWGSSHLYSFAGMKNIHPTYVQYLQKKDFLTNESKQKILSKVGNSDINEKTKFQKNLIDNLISENSLKASVVIPARMKSSRFYGKPLEKILGIPMVIRVAEIAEAAVGKNNVYIATDEEIISDTVKQYGFKSIMTKDARTGTDRLCEAVAGIDSDIIINLQGDEPLINPEDIKKVIEYKKNNLNCIVNCYSNLQESEKEDNSIPKIIVDKHDNLVYSSRNAIPGKKETLKKDKTKYYKQVCIYGFTKKELQFFGENQVGPLEQSEDIEILRFIENGKKVKMIYLDTESIAVDYPEDIKKVENLLLTKELT